MQKKSIRAEKDVVTFNSERPEHRVGEGELSEAASVLAGPHLSGGCCWGVGGEAAAAGDL